MTNIALSSDTASSSIDTTTNIITSVANHLQEENSVMFISLGVIMAYLGYLVWFVNYVLTRDKYSDRTPFEFSWKFLWQDNWKDFLKAFITMPFVVIFYPEIFNIIFYYSGKMFGSERIKIFEGYSTLTTFTSFIIGLFWTWFTKVILPKIKEAISSIINSALSKFNKNNKNEQKGDKTSSGNDM